MGLGSSRQATPRTPSSTRSATAPMTPAERQLLLRRIEDLESKLSAHTSLNEDRKAQLEELASKHTQFTRQLSYIVGEEGDFADEEMPQRRSSASQLRVELAEQGEKELQLIESIKKRDRDQADEIERLHEQLEKLQKEADEKSDYLKAGMQAMQQNIDDLERECQELRETDAGDVQALRDEVAQYEVRQKHMEEQHVQDRTLLEENADSLERMRLENDRLRAEVAELEELKKQRGEVAAKMRRMAELEEALLQSRTTKEEAQRSLRMKHKQLTSQMEELETLQMRNSLLQKMVRDVRKERDSMKDKSRKVKQLAKTLEDEKADMEFQLLYGNTAKDRQIEALQQRERDLRQQHEQALLELEVALREVKQQSFREFLSAQGAALQEEDDTETPSNSNKAATQGGLFDVLLI
ncbi:MAG: hypothetical protein MHM6MM_000501 [Cercozoa sp. M6MM]